MNRLSLGTLTLVLFSASALAAPGPLSWSKAQVAVANGAFDDVINAQGRYVAVGAAPLTGTPKTQPLVASSFTGVDWEPFLPAPGLPGALSSVTYGNGHFVAVGAGFTATSVDGLVWLPMPLPTGVELNGVAFGGGWFVAAGQQDLGGGNNAGQIWFSADGILWLPAIAPVIAGEYLGVAANGGDFVVVGSTGTGTSTATSAYVPLISLPGASHLPGGFGVPTSPVAIWKKESSLGNLAVTRLRYVNGLFQAIGINAASQAPEILTSSDGSSWTTENLASQQATGVPTDLTKYGSYYYSAGLFQGVGVSADGATDWVSAGFPTSASAVAMTVGPQTFVAVGDDSNQTDTDVYYTTSAASGSSSFSSAPSGEDTQVIVDENTTATGTLTVSNAGTDPLTFTITTSAASGKSTVSATTGEFTYVPDANYTGVDNFIYTVKDTTTGLVSNPVTVSITVLPTSVSSSPVAEDGLFTADDTGTVVGDLSAEDPAGNSVSFAVVSGPSLGTLTLATDGSFTYKTSSATSGEDSFTFEVTDTITHLVSNAATVYVLVYPTGYPSLPPLAEDPIYVQVSQGGVLDASVAGSDSAGDTLSYAAASKPAHGTLTLTGSTGGFIYTPTAAYSGTDSFTYTATDKTTKDVSNTATVVITVVPTVASTPAPVASAVTLSTVAGQTVTASLNVVDAAGNALSYGVIQQPLDGTVVLTGIGSEFTYTPNASYSGSDTFTYQATDVSSGLASNTATVSITVSAAVASTSTGGGGTSGGTSPGLLGPPSGGGVFGPCDVLLLLFGLGLTRRRRLTPAPGR